MAIKINGKEYDENKFDDKTKNYVIARQVLFKIRRDWRLKWKKFKYLSDITMRKSVSS